MFEFNYKYSRKDIENLIDGERKNYASGSYYKIKNKGIAFIKKDKDNNRIYNNYAINNESISWDDSIGKKIGPADKLFNDVEQMFFFHEVTEKPVRYLLIGKLKSFEPKETGIKNQKPNTFKINFESKMTNQVMLLLKKK